MTRSFASTLGLPAIVSALALVLALNATAADTRRSNLNAGDDRLADESEENDWLAYGRTHSERRFSPLRQIHDGNVAALNVDWYLDLPNDVGLVSTPLVIDGILYFIGTMNVVRAVDAATGRLIWEFDPEVAPAIAGRRQMGQVHCRGISFSQGRLFVPTWDGRLIALDVKTGRPLWSVRTYPQTEALYVTGAPKAFKDKVLIGNGGTEGGPARGFVSAFDAATGKLAWKFFIVPGNPADGFENEAMAMAAKTWTGEWWQHGGGGNAWHGFTYDAELDTLYIGTGNGAPYNGKIRSPGGGDNLFLCSIVALNPDTGAYKWHYQTTPGEVWDYTSNMDIVLADLRIGGRTIKAILHAPKNGFFYVIDRTIGKLVSAERFAKTTWASHIDRETGRPVEIPGARYETGRAEIWPGTQGAHSWHAMSYNPITGLVYLPVIHAGTIFDDTGIALKTWRAKAFQGRSIGVAVSTAPVPPGHIPGSLDAWDPVAQKRVWSVPLTGGWNSGTLTTAGNLVFQGRTDGRVVAHQARSGEVLWSIDVGLGVSAPPITYRVGDTQYVAVLVGWGGNGSGLRGAEHGWSYGVHTRRLVAFSLRGKATLPVQPPPTFAVPLRPEEFRTDLTQVAEGGRLYTTYCGSCHGPGAMSGGMAPDLRASPVLLDPAALAHVVRDGGRVARAMPQFPEITDDELRALTHFVRKMASEASHRSAAHTGGGRN